VTGKMLDYTVHMSSIQAKYWDEEEKSGAKRRCGVQVGGAPGVRSHRPRAKMPFVLPIRVRFLQARRQILQLQHSVPKLSSQGVLRRAQGLDLGQDVRQRDLLPLYLVP